MAKANDPTTTQYACITTTSQCADIITILWEGERVGEGEGRGERASRVEGGVTSRGVRCGCV